MSFPILGRSVAGALLFFFGFRRSALGIRNYRRLALPFAGRHDAFYDADALSVGTINAILPVPYHPSKIHHVTKLQSNNTNYLPGQTGGDFARTNSFFWLRSASAVEIVHYAGRFFLAFGHGFFGAGAALRRASGPFHVIPIESWDSFRSGWYTVRVFQGDVA